MSLNPYSRSGRLMTKDDATRAGKLDSPEYRLANQIRFACALTSKAGRDDYFAMVADRDGPAYAADLRDKAIDHWKRTKGLQ